MSNISVVIPCYPPHLPCIDRVLEDIVGQTLLPKQVVLAVSEINDDAKISLYQKFVGLFEKNRIDFQIIATVAKQFAGTNRNMGAKPATGEYVMFIDADDTIHPRKIELTKYFLDKYKPNLLLHSYVNSQPSNFLKSLDLNPEKCDTILQDAISHGTFGSPPKRNRLRELQRKKNTSLRIKSNTKYNIAHGYITVRRTLLQKHQFVDRKTGEDKIFVKDILWKEKNVVFVDLPLLNYEPLLS